MHSEAGEQKFKTPISALSMLSPREVLMFNNAGTAVFRLVVQKLRRESTHARPFGGDFELKILRMRGFSSRFLDNQPENCCS